MRRTRATLLFLQYSVPLLGMQLQGLVPLQILLVILS